MPEVKPDQNKKGRFLSKNRAAITHGVRAFLATGSLPRGASYIRRNLNQFQDALEAAVIDRKGEVSLYSSCLIQSAIRHEGRASLMQRWLRVNEGELTINMQIHVLKEIGAATDARDKCLKSLGLDDADMRDNILEALYGSVTNLDRAREQSIEQNL